MEGPKFIRRCWHCGRRITEIPYECHRCGKYFCRDCRLPENHHCQHTTRTSRINKGTIKYPSQSARKLKKYSRRLLNLIRDLITAGIIIGVTGIVVLVVLLPNASYFFNSHNPVSDTMKSTLNLPTETTIDESKKDIDYINNLRVANGVNPIQFDSRVYNLALARVRDMDKYSYLDHTNPQTGTCAYSIKSQFGLNSNEFVAENAYGYFVNGQGEYHSGIETDAMNSWMTDRGHKYNMLYPHISGAVACSSGGHCVFEGLNHDQFTNACYTAAQGEAFWNSAGTQPYEHS